MTEFYFRNISFVELRYIKSGSRRRIHPLAVVVVSERYTRFNEKGNMKKFEIFSKKTIDKRKTEDYNAIIALAHKNFKAMRL